MKLQVMASQFLECMLSLDIRRPLRWQMEVIASVTRTYPSNLTSPVGPQIESRVFGLGGGGAEVR